MKFTLESGAGHRVSNARSDAVTIAGKRYEASLIITPDTLDANWSCARLADLTQAHLDAILALEPAVVVIGTGAQLRFPPAELRSYLPTRGVGVEFMDTVAACRTYNVLADEGRVVVAALII